MHTQMSLTSRGGQSLTPLSVPVTASGIAFPSDVEHRFGNYTPQYFNPPGGERGGAAINISPQADERFINWMRLSAMPLFRKLWGKAYVDLKAGDVVTVTITNRYNTYAFNGKKSLVIGTTTWLGGRSVFLGIVYIAAGGVAMLLGFVYTVVAIVKPRKFGDISVLMK
jgi:hypothetical protein